jgi:hypothetical protein
VARVFHKPERRENTRSRVKPPTSERRGHQARPADQRESRQVAVKERRDKRKKPDQKRESDEKRRGKRDKRGS